MENEPTSSLAPVDGVTRIAYRIGSGVVGLCLVLYCGLAVAQVVLRYVFSSSLFWVEEISVIAFVLMIWVAAPALWLSREHLALDFLPIARTRVGAIVADLTMIVIGSVAAYASIDTINAFSVLALPIWDLDYGFKLYPISAGLVSLVAAAAYSLARNLRRARR
ncbi:MAG: TRAP transporter small permease subunit [Burkholderiaceae bacterium]|nr:TRAP transporter small permease subunit [Burkholderiaceae bacterium]